VRNDGEKERKGEREKERRGDKKIIDNLKMD
jgi:hypothetical protein